MGRRNAIVWTQGGTRSYAELLGFLAQQPYSDPIARGREIRTAIKRLRYAPLACAVRYVRGGRHYRQLVVNGRYFVFYLYFPPRTSGRPGRVSIRAVKHSARRYPFAGVKELSAPQYCVDR